MKVSLVASGAGENLEGWSEFIFGQTRLPDEIVVIGTSGHEALARNLPGLSKRSPAPMTAIPSSNVNVAQGRNLGITQAKYQIIVMTDLKAAPHPEWLERITAPFEVDSQTQVSFGPSLSQTTRKRFGRQRLVPEAVPFNVQALLPGSDSLAFKKDIWSLSGGYPEWLDGPGADLLFAVELKRMARHWAFVPDARVDWQSPESFNVFWKRIYLESKGDGATGVRADFYWKAALTGLLVFFILFMVILLIASGFLTKNLIGPGLGAIALAGLAGSLLATEWIHGYSILDAIWRIAVWPARMRGFLEGRKDRYETTRRRLQGVEGVMFILTGVPIDDTGGGSRYSQIAQELIRQRFAVIYINRYPKDEMVELPYPFSHPNLFCYLLSNFSLDEFLQETGLELSRRRVGVLVELPHPDWLPLLGSLKEKGARLIYDLVDDWSTGLGADWYSPDIENLIVQASDSLVATAPSLVEHLENLAGRPVALLPNAVNLRLFSFDRLYTRPRDWPDGDWSIIYTGSLYGSWFDWDLLLEVARHYPEAAVVVIGDYLGQCPQALPNLHFLGLKPNRELPAYLSLSTVAIIPWKLNAITKATNPLKVYEYLAMGKPVVAPDLPPLKGIPGLIRAQSQEEFVEAVGVARKTSCDMEAVLRFVQENSWQSRVNQLLRLLG